jgi:hypothetical protein
VCLPRPLCEHCHRWLQMLGRRLCWGCRRDPVLRRRYPLAGSAAEKFGRRGILTGHGRTPPPTTARPGSDEYLEVLCQRAEAGYGLFRADERLPVHAEPPARQLREGEKIHFNGKDRYAVAS